MKNFLGVLIFIVLVIISVKFLFFIAPYIIVGALLLWMYFGYIRPFFKKSKEKRQEKKDDKKEDVVVEEQDDLYDGPVIDVDYEEVNEDKHKDKK